MTPPHLAWAFGHFELHRISTDLDGLQSRTALSNVLNRRVRASTLPAKLLSLETISFLEVHGTGPGPTAQAGKKLRKQVKRMGDQPSPDKVHQLRTNTRRFEATFEALSLEGRGLGASVLQKLGRCRKRAGKVRDMDVLTSYASTIHLRGEDECTVQLLEHLGARRRKGAKKLHAEVRRLGPALRRKLKHTSSVVKKAMQNDRDGSGEPGLAPHAAANAVNLAIQLATPSRLGRQNLHPYRLKVKELRNILQMAAGPWRHAFVDDLGEVKDAIGEWHDWQELISIAQEAATEERTFCNGAKAFPVSTSGTLSPYWRHEARSPSMKRSAASKFKNGSASQPPKVSVIIETPKGSRNKLKHDPSRHMFKLSKVMPEGMIFPYDFGFVPGTRAEDGDPLDVLVLTDAPLFPGCLVDCNLICVIEAEQEVEGEMKRNDRLIAVAQASILYSEVKDLAQLNPTLLKQIEAFFVNYQKVREVEMSILDHHGPDRALEILHRGKRGVHKS